MDQPRRQPAFRTRNREVSLLFADLRGFTELAGSLEMDPMFGELLGHLMDALSDAVIEQRGLIVDYYGDGLVAMWNAPHDQEHHAELACEAALRMLEAIPVVTAEWRDVIEKDLRLGIGVHTGFVHVGNAGSSRQAKYGPRGTNVNLTSRVEAATKELALPFVATRATAERLGELFATNRVCRAHMPGLRQSVDLYSVRRPDQCARSSAAWRLYDEALGLFEEGRYEAAVQTLATIDARIVDVPTQFLLERAERELGRQQRRRSTDQPASTAGGVISISAK